MQTQLEAWAEADETGCPSDEWERALAVAEAEGRDAIPVKKEEQQKNRELLGLENAGGGCQVLAERRSFTHDNISETFPAFS